MIIIPLVRTSDDHDDKVLALVRTEVVHGRLQEVLVLDDPFGKVEWWGQGHRLLSPRSYYTLQVIKLSVVSC